MKSIWVSKKEFENVLHGNRSIENQNLKENEIVQVFCKDYIAYSYPVEAKVKRIYLDTIKTTPGVRTSRFPFL